MNALPKRRQVLIFLKEWHRPGLVPAARPVPLPPEGPPDRVWTLYDYTDEASAPTLSYLPRHNVNAFLEDAGHDWHVTGDKFFYTSHVADRPVWVLLEYDAI